MNLAEFPLTILSTRGSPKVKTLEFSDTIKGKNGELLNRSWIITGADKFGLPTASDDEVLLGLLKLTVDDGVKDPKIYFTRYELLRILRWSTEGRSYSRLQKALDRLSGVRIKTTNGFYDNESKLHSTKNFGILDAYEINDGRDVAPKSSFFTWSEVLFKSFQVGFIKKLDLDFYLNLKSAVSKRLYRYLDKHFWYKAKVQINLFTLAHEKIGISRNYRFSSSIRQQLDPAIEELTQVGFLTGCEYQGRGQGTEIILYGAKTKAALPAKIEETPKVAAKSAQAHVRMQAGEPCDATRESIIRALVQRGLKESQMDLLLPIERGVAELTRIAAIVDYFDQLVNSKSKLISRSPVGFLYHAIKNAENFVLPSEAAARGPGKVSALRRAEPQGTQQRRAAENRGNEFKPAAKTTRQSMETRYLVERKQEIFRLKEEVEGDLLYKLRKEVETALVKLRGQISEQRFLEAVEHGVEERLAKLFAVPDFDEWLKREDSMRVVA